MGRRLEDTVQDGRQLLIRGNPAARAQWRFHCAVHNLLKLHRAGGLDLISNQNGRNLRSPSTISADRPERIASIALTAPGS